MKWKSGPRSLTHPMTHFFSRQRQMASHGTTRCHTVAWSAPQHSGAHLRAQRSSIQPVRSQDTASSYRPGCKSQDAEPGCRARVQSQYAASTEPVQSQDTEPVQSQSRGRTHSQDTQPGYTARIHSQVTQPVRSQYTSSTQPDRYAASIEPVQSQYAASTEPGYTARIRRILSQDTQPVQSQYRASTEPVHSQDTQPGYRARIQEAGYTTRIQSQPRYAASTQPAGSQYRASTQPVHKEVQSQYRASTQDTQPVHNQ